jgi:hypothetical protein
MRLSVVDNEGGPRGEKEEEQILLWSCFSVPECIIQHGIISIECTRKVGGEVQADHGTLNGKI